jgi:hypothetical protein
MKETNNKYSCCSRIIKYFCAAQKSLLSFRAAHWNKQKYFNTFALLWDDTKRSNCPGRAGFAKAWYMKSFTLVLNRHYCRQHVVPLSITSLSIMSLESDKECICNREIDKGQAGAYTLLARGLDAGPW